MVLASKPRIALTIPVIPLLGVRYTQKSLNNTITQSIYIDDDHIASHPRFKTLTKNIRLRRGEKVDIQVPLFKDSHTSLE
jgi:glutamate--cysteine ligase catalytic subunit